MKKENKLINVINQGGGGIERVGRFFWGSLALCLCMNVSFGSCASSSGTIGICVDNQPDTSTSLGITWNGLYGGKDIYQPLKKGGIPIKTLKFAFDSNHYDEDFIATIRGTSLEINGNEKSLQMDDGKGTIAFWLKDDGDKAITLNLGKKDSRNPALIGSLVLDGEYETNAFTGNFGGAGISGDVTLGSFGTNSFSFTNQARISGKITLQAGKTTIESSEKSTAIQGGIYSNGGSGDLIFKDKSVCITGNLDDNRENLGNSAILANGGIISLRFEAQDQTIAIENKISVSSQSTSYALIEVTKENSTLILNGISTKNGGNGTRIQFGGESAKLIFKTNPQHNSSHFNIEGNGDNDIVFDGENSTIQGNFSSSGLGSNSVTFKQNGKIEGNIHTQKSQNIFSFQGSGTNIIIGNIYTSGFSGLTSIDFTRQDAENTIQGNVNTSSGKTDINFRGNGNVNGKVYTEGGESSISFNSQQVSIGGFEVGGSIRALNRVLAYDGELTVLSIAFGDGVGNSFYVKNPNGKNSIQTPRGSITTTHAITSIYGRNHLGTKVLTIQSGGIHAVGAEHSAHNIIITQSAKIDGDITAQNTAENILDFRGEQSSVMLGDQSPLAILSGSGKNILSFSSGDKNILKLTQIHTTSGENHLGKTLLMETKTFNRPLAKYRLSSSNAFSGKMTISKGIGTTGGKNIILFSTTSNQTSSIISHFTKTHSTFSLQNAIFASNSGSNSLWLNTSSSSLPSLKSATTTYLETPHSPESLETLALSATISGNISTQGGDNHIFIKGSNEKNKTSFALFGNINTEGGSNNLDMKDTLITPSSLIDSNGKVTDIGGGLSGNIITTSGMTNISTSLTHSPFGDSDTLVYTLTSHGGESNLSFDGEINVEIKTRYKQGSRSNLIFATLSEGEESSLKTQGTNPKENRILGKTYKDGFKVTIRGVGTSSSLSSSITSTHNSNHHTLSLGGTTFGSISLLDLGANSEKQVTKAPSVIIESRSEFWGNIKPNANHFPTLTLKERAKVVFKDIDSTSSNNFSIPTLSIEGKAQNYPSATIGIATQMKSNDFGLLTIGGSTQKEKGTGLQGESGGMFLTRIKLGANQNTATLGGGEVGKYGYTYSDRIIIANIGDNTTAQGGVYYLGFFVDGGEGIEKIRYNSSQDSGNSEKGGTKTEGNIAVLTVVNTEDGKAGIDLKLKEGKKGFDKISGTLTSAPTDINGVYNENGGYITYFIGGMTTNGVSQEREKVSAAALGANYELYIVNLNSLNKRMGELRDNPYSQGVWGRIFGGVVSNDFGLQTKTSYITLQGGYDYAFGSEEAKDYLGLALAYGTSTSKTQNTLSNDQEFLSIKSTKSSAIEVALYNSYVQDEGWYNDTIAKFSYIFSTFSITGEDSTYSTSNMAFTLSDEFGYRFKLGDEREWFIDPQAEVAFGYFNQTKFIQSLEDSWLENIAKGIFVMRSRFGSSFGYDFKKFTANKPIKASVYVGAFYEYDYIKGGDITLTTNLGGVNSSLGAISSDGRVVMNVGTNMTIKDNTRIYFDFEKSFAGKINTDYQINLGVRYSFGENPTPKSEDKKESLPLRIEQTDWEE